MNVISIEERILKSVKPRNEVDNQDELKKVILAEYNSALEKIKQNMVASSIKEATQEIIAQVNPDDKIISPAVLIQDDAPASLNEEQENSQLILDEISSHHLPYTRLVAEETTETAEGLGKKGFEIRVFSDSIVVWPHVGPSYPLAEAAEKSGCTITDFTKHKEIKAVLKLAYRGESLPEKISSA